MTTDPKILGLALLGGIAPALIWLWFWLKEDNQKPEPKGLIATIFIIGMIAVIFVIPIQKFIQSSIISYEWQTIAWASAEELIKYLGVVILLYKTNRIDEPIDWPIFLITAAFLPDSLHLSRYISLIYRSFSSTLPFKNIIPPDHSY